MEKALAGARAAEKAGAAAVKVAADITGASTYPQTTRNATQAWRSQLLTNARLLRDTRKSDP